MKPAALVLCALILAPAASRACLQDRDSLAVEARGVPDVMRALSGRFERNPALFYEMRMQRVERELQTAPQRLDLYDDIAVAADRLGRDDEALAWAEKKRARLQVLDATQPDVREHWYRYWANAGTFRAHRWIHNGADRKNLGEMEQARGEIARAISIKPGAHFGREKYQLKAMDWILKPPSTKGLEDGLPNLLGLPQDDTPMSQRIGQAELAKRGYQDAERGLTGLITLGAAWQSIDVFNALRHVEVWQSNNSVVYLLNRRLEELARSGGASLHPQAPRGTALVERFKHRGGYDDRWQTTFGGSEKELGATYTRLREEADAWHERRTAWMLERLNAGRHPDTDASFWNGWDDGTPPTLPGQSFWDTRFGPAGPAVRSLSILLLTGAVSALIVWMAARRLRSRRAAA